MLQSLIYLPFIHPSIHPIKSLHLLSKHRPLNPRATSYAPPSALPALSPMSASQATHHHRFKPMKLYPLLTLPEKHTSKRSAGARLKDLVRYEQTRFEHVIKYSIIEKMLLYAKAPSALGLARLGNLHHLQNPPLHKNHKILPGKCAATISPEHSHQDCPLPTIRKGCHSNQHFCLNAQKDALTVARSTIKYIHFRAGHGEKAPRLQSMTGKLPASLWRPAPQDGLWHRLPTWHGREAAHV